MVSASIDVASSVSKASVKARVGKSDPSPAGNGFSALVDSNVADAKAATPADPAPVRSQPAARSDESRGSNDRKGDQQPKTATKTATASDKPAEASAPTDTTPTDTVVTETPVVTISLEGAVSIAADTLPVEDVTAKPDPAADANASATADTNAQPVVTGIVQPVVAVPVIAATISIDAAPATPTDPIAINTASSANTSPAETQASGSPAPAVAPEQTAEQTAEQAVASAPVVADPATKAKPAASAAALIETKADADGTPVVDVKPQAIAEVPVVETKPAAKPEATEKPAAKAEAKTETAAQPDAAAPTRETRPAHVANAEVQADATASTPAPTTTTPSVPHTQTPQLTATAHVAATPINTGVQLASNIAVPVSGLAVNIAFNANAGRSRFEIRLDPAELGRIDVRLEVDRNGQVTSHLTVERPSTLDMLRRDAPQLQRALEDTGLKTGDSGLQFSLRDQSQQQSGSDDRSSRGQSYRLVVDEMPALPAEAGRTYGRLAAARGGVDIRI